MLIWLGVWEGSWGVGLSACSVSASYLFPVWMGIGRLVWSVVDGFFFLGAAFFDLALIHGLSVRRVCLSLSLAVLYLSSLVRHLHELARCLWSLIRSTQQLVHFSSCGHVPLECISGILWGWGFDVQLWGGGSCTVGMLVFPCIGQLCGLSSSIFSIGILGVFLGTLLTSSVC